jgi:S1-C subfamily serine protease
VIALVLILGVATAVAIGVGQAMRDRSAVDDNAGGTPSTAPYSQGPGTRAPAGPLDANAIASKVDPGVVDVNTTLGFQNARAAGTGVILNSSGLVLTNNHVIADATQISVTSVGNGRTYQASVVGYDRSEDIAVIQMKGASGLPTVTIGDSSKVRVGDPIVAIGNAGGTGGTPAAVSGTVTALDQSITATDENGGSAEQLTGLIEVAADIQSGDSGGPLVNSAGQVIGIDTAAAVDFQMQASGGQGYAIPINQAMSIGNQIRNGQASAKIHIGETAFLGVQTQAPSGRSGGGGGGTGGAPVAGVVSGSPADDLGLGQGDVIVSLGGQTVDSPTTLTTLMDRYHPGDKVTVGWTDGTGRSHSASVKLVSGPAG